MQYTIYKIVNKVKGLVYVGSTKNFQQRKTKHLLRARSGEYKGYNKLYPAINEFGANNFSFVIIETCDQAQAIEGEMYWIGVYDSRNAGYNVIDDEHKVKYWEGKERSEETKRKVSAGLTGKLLPASVKAKMSEAHKGNHPLRASEARQRKVICLETGQVFESIVLAAASVSKDPSGIIGVIKNKRKTCGGYRWAYQTA